MMNNNRRWPYGFLDDFWQYTVFSSDEETQALDITNDKELTGSVEYVLTVCSLSDKELQILRKHYQQHITYRDIGREYGVTGSRVREIASHAMSKLRKNPLYKGILLHGIAAFARQRYKMRMTSEFEKSVEERVAQIRQDEHECRMRGLQFRPQGKDKESNHLTSKSKIADLNLSVRSFNALMRSGRKTISDLLDIKNRETLLSIRNLGVKSADEILKTLQRKGFDVAHLL